MSNIFEYFVETLETDPRTADSLLDVDEWKAIGLDTPTGEACTKLIASAHNLLQHIRDCDDASTLVPALIRSTVIAVDDQIWNG